MGTPTRSVLAAVLLLGLVLPTGCTLSRRAAAPVEEDAPFSCEREAPKEEPRPVPVIALPTGQLDIACQPEAPAAPPKPAASAEADAEGTGEGAREEAPSEEQRFFSRRCRIVAHAVPMVEVAIALSAATGYNVTVQPEVMPLRVGVSMPETTVWQFVNSLSSENGRVTLSVHGGTARFGWREAGTCPLCSEELLVRIVPIPTGVPGRQLASTVCQQLLSHRGGVSLIGRRLYVSDVRENQERIEALLRTLGPPAAP